MTKSSSPYWEDNEDEIPKPKKSQGVVSGSLSAFGVISTDYFLYLSILFLFTLIILSGPITKFQKHLNLSWGKNIYIYLIIIFLVSVIVLLGWRHLMIKHKVLALITGVMSILGIVISLIVLSVTASKIESVAETVVDSIRSVEKAVNNIPLS